MKADGGELAHHLSSLTPTRAAAIGQAARRRLLAEHTYEQRARQVDEILRGRRAPQEAPTVRRASEALGPEV